MRRHVAYLFAVACIMSTKAPALGRQTGSDAAREVIQVEKKFADDARSHGVRNGFLMYLSDSAVVFRETPVNAKAWYQAQESSSELLTWRPQFAEASVDGSLGYSTGPWELRETAESPVLAFGQYFTVWRKEEGAWRAVLDYGVRLAQPQSETTPVSTINARGKPHKTSLQSIMSADSALALKTETKGAATALCAVASSDVLTLRAKEGMTARSGRCARFPAAPGDFGFTPLGGGVARAGDMGYTYGSYHQRGKGFAEEAGFYVRIWRWDGNAWVIAFDIHRPQPVAPAPVAPAAPANGARVAMEAYARAVSAWDTASIRSALLPDIKIRGSEGGKFDVTSADSWLAAMKPAYTGGNVALLHMDTTADAGAAAIVFTTPAMAFEHVVTMIRTEAGWKVAAIGGVAGSAESNGKRPAPPEPGDPEKIAAAVNDYIKGVNTNDAAAIDRAFDPGAELSASVRGRIFRQPFSEWKSFTASPLPPQAAARTGSIVSTQQSGGVAVAKVDLDWPRLHYIDFLMLMRIGDNWRIVNKVWFQEMKQ